MSMITDLISELMGLADYFKQHDFMRRYNLIKRTISTIEELSAKLQATNMERSSQCYNGGWVSVEDRLPEPQEDGDADYSDWVLITLHIGRK